MELIDIIYKVLIYGGLFLLIVILVSYILSHSRIKKIKKKNNNLIKGIYDHTVYQKNYQTLREDQITPLIIHQIDQSKVRELKVIRKPTATRGGQQRDFYSNERNNGKGSRYTIINEDRQNILNNNAVNFYL